MTLISRFLTFVFVVSLLAMSPNVADAGRHCGADGCGGGGDDSGPGGGKKGGGSGSGGGGDEDLTFKEGASGYPDTYDWMHGDVEIAFSHGYTGAGSTIFVVDDYVVTTDNSLSGNLANLPETGQSHGYWTSTQAGIVAPGATVVELQWDFNLGSQRIEDNEFWGTGLNVVNQSYSLFVPAGAKLLNFGTQNNSIVTAADNGTAVVVKAAGNYRHPIDAVLCCINNAEVQDGMNIALIGKQGALFVGALSDHGTVDGAGNGTGVLAEYSSYAGSNKRAQKQFLVVGVPFADMGDLAGTSFAAPVVSGYAAILGQKFDAATPALIVDQLLDTARTDTILNYSPTLHGQGEADLSRALAPVSIN